MAKLYFRYGVMGASKSAEALMTIHNYEKQGLKVLALKPSNDVRDGEEIKSRIGLWHHANCLEPNTLPSHLMIDPLSYKAIVVDEAQFLTEQQIDNLRMIADAWNVTVFCYGLRTDFQTNLFPGSKRLMEVADAIEEMKYICKCGKKAVFNARFDTAGHMCLTGEQRDVVPHTYKALCSDCYYREKTKEKNRLR